MDKGAGERAGNLGFNPRAEILENSLLRMANGIATIRPGKPFDILVANLGETTQRLPKGMALATALRHTGHAIPTEHSVGEVLNIEVEPGGPNPLEVRNSRQAEEVERIPSVDELEFQMCSIVSMSEFNRCCENIVSYGTVAMGSSKLRTTGLKPPEYDAPMRQPPHRNEFTQRQFCKEQVDLLVNAEIARPS